MFTDISEEKKQQQRLEFLAHCDPLTGLANRRSFGEQLALAVREAAAHGEVMAVLLLNLDRFKDVNDSYGHAVGDEVLKHITRQVRAALRPGDLVGRMAGDEFAVLARNLRDRGYVVVFGKLADDPAALARVRNARAVGMAVGLYHFWRVSQPAAAVSMALLLRAVSALV